jgi:predicted SprT family Zn-dependent metalloprotease
MTPTTVALMKQKVDECIQKARTKYGVTLADVDVRFDIRGHRIAGQAGHRYGTFFLRFHPVACEQHLQEMLDEVVPHEVAHLVCYEKPLLGRKHNWGWKNVCIGLGGTGSRTHTLNLGGPSMQDKLEAHKSRRPFIYLDSKGTERPVTSQLHKSIQFKGKAYIYRDNKGRIDRTCFLRDERTARPAQPKPTLKPLVTLPTVPTPNVGGGTKADKCRELIRAHYGKMTDTALIDLIATTCGLKRQLASAYFKNNLARAWRKV